MEKNKTFPRVYYKDKRSVPENEVMIVQTVNIAEPPLLLEKPSR